MHIVWIALQTDKHPINAGLPSFFFNKNIFYENIEAEICEILRIC